MSELTLGSLFDGSGGFPLGGLLSGITPVWASEIEPFPIRVTTKRLPHMKHYGDVTLMDGGKVKPVDVVTFGSPCQDMSVAGKREGLDGSRSSLFYEAIRIIREMRCATDGKYPRYIVWENVPGAFSSNSGEDFRCVLENVCRIVDETVSVPPVRKWLHAGSIVGDGYSVAWRLLDARYWGVPQRRKRIYLVADLAGGSAGKILFESEGLSGYSAEGFRAWQRAAAHAGEGAQEAGGVICLNDQGGERMDVSTDEVNTLRAEARHPPVVMEAAGFCTEHSARSRSIGFEGETSPTIRAGTVPAAVYENHGQDTRYTGPLDAAQTVLSTFGTGGNNQPFVVEDLKAYGICSRDSEGMKSANPKVGFYEAETSRTLDANGGNPSCSQGGVAVVAQKENSAAYGIDRATYNMGRNAKFGITVEEEAEPTMVAKGPGAVAHPVYSTSKNSYHTEAEKELANTLVATDYKDPPLVNDGEYVVRRLTPVECARLQGFPDWWCRGLGTEKPTDEELYFWYGVFETWRKAVSPESKTKSSKQIRRWLEDPHSDSAEYKLWGNGVALPCVVFVLSGIVYYARNDGL